MLKYLYFLFFIILLLLFGRFHLLTTYLNINE